ncbi:hypothetical protein ACWEO4_42540 [Streptomyces sp. NPDC004393]
MANEQRVVVHPLHKGQRTVTMGMRVLGTARSRKKLNEDILRRHNLSDRDVDEWLGGGRWTWEANTGPGDRTSPRRTATATLLVIGLLATAALLGNIGRIDIGSALTIAGIIAGALALAAAAVTFIAAIVIVVDYSLRRPSKYSGIVVLSGVLAVFVANSLLLIVQIYGREYTDWLWAWLIFILWSAWACWELLHRQRAWEEMPHRRKITAMISATTVAGVANFFYAQIYQPYNSPITVSATSRFGTPRVSVDHKIMYLPVTFHYKNTSKISEILFAAPYVIYGESFKKNTGPKEISRWIKEIQDNQSADGQGWDLQEFAADPPRSHLIGHGLITPKASLSPGEELTVEKTIELSNEPASPYDVMIAKTDAIVARRDRITIPQTPSKWRTKEEKRVKSLPDWVADDSRINKADRKNCQYLEKDIPVNYGNEILRLTRKPRFVTLWWILGTPEQPRSTLKATLARKDGEKIRPNPEDLAARYGFKSSFYGSAEVQPFQVRQNR